MSPQTGPWSINLILQEFALFFLRDIRGTHSGSAPKVYDVCEAKIGDAWYSVLIVDIKNGKPVKDVLDLFLVHESERVYEHVGQFFMKNVQTGNVVTEKQMSEESDKSRATLGSRSPEFKLPPEFHPNGSSTSSSRADSESVQQPETGHDSDRVLPVSASSTKIESFDADEVELGSCPLTRSRPPALAVKTVTRPPRQPIFGIASFLGGTSDPDGGGFGLGSGSPPSLSSSLTTDSESRTRSESPVFIRESGQSRLDPTCSAPNLRRRPDNSRGRPVSVSAGHLSRPKAGWASSLRKSPRDFSDSEPEEDEKNMADHDGKQLTELEENVDDDVDADPDFTVNSETTSRSVRSAKRQNTTQCDDGPPMVHQRFQTADEELGIEKKPGRKAGSQENVQDYYVQSVPDLIEQNASGDKVLPPVSSATVQDEMLADYMECDQQGREQWRAALRRGVRIICPSPQLMLYGYSVHGKGNHKSNQAAVHFKGLHSLFGMLGHVCELRNCKKPSHVQIMTVMREFVASKRQDTRRSARKMAKLES